MPSLRARCMRVCSTWVTFSSASFCGLPLWYSFPYSSSRMSSLLTRTRLGACVTHCFAQVDFPEAGSPLVKINSCSCAIVVYT